MSLSTANITQQNNERVSKILEVVMAYARLDFSQKTEVLGNEDALDAIGAGVNMLGEELEMSTISLKEKEQLLKEIHHRVKNNLQIVSSLLSLQSENIKDQNFLNLILASRNRINSMALVHEMLYASSDLKKIEIGIYVKRLCNNINSSLSKPDSKIIFDYKIQNNYFFDIDRMIPLGLILNEIITNSLKYAFPNNQGQISIEMGETENGNVLTVSDNGLGFSKGFNFEKDGNLGLQLINMLTTQLEGKLILNTNKGVGYKITFK
jgi:two-component sensor histidine kinase